MPDQIVVPGSPVAVPTLDDADGDITTDEEITDSLIKGLETLTDDDDSSSEDEVGASNADASAWPALRSAAYMTGTLQFVKEKHRVQGYLAAELARAQQELDEDGDDRPPRRRPTLEGDIDHYSIKKQITRRQNKKSPGFLSAVRMIWDATRAEMAARLGESCDADDDDEEDSSGVDKAAFVCLMVKVHYLIICPPVDREVADENACNDWAKDHTDGGRHMSYESFVASMFELVDLWTETLESKEYDDLAMMIAKGVTTEVGTTEEAPPNSGDNPSEREGGKEQERGGRTDSMERAPLLRTRRFLLKSDASIVYEPNITREPVHMQDLTEEVDDEEDETNHDGGGCNVEEEQDATKSPRTIGRADGSRNNGRKLPGGVWKRFRRVVNRRFGVVHGFKKNLPSGSPKFGTGELGVHSAVSSLSQASRPSKTPLLSTERVNAQIAKIYCSKMQVDQKLLKRDGNLSWVDKCKRKKDQRMDRFVIQYHIRHFGTKKLARRNLHQLCKSISKLAPNNPRISVFADLTGVSAIAQRLSAGQPAEFKPFACSDFIIPMFSKLCPPGESINRWLGNGKVPVSITMSDFMQAVKEVCPDVPTTCPVFVSFVVQVGELVERLEKRSRQEKLKKPNAARPSLDLDEALMAAMRVWSAEEQYLIMKVTLNAVHTLRQWMKRWRRRKEAGETLHSPREILPSPTRREPNARRKSVATVRKFRRPTNATSQQLTKALNDILNEPPRSTDAAVAEPDLPGRQQQQESASSLAGIPTSGDATATETTSVHESPVPAVGGKNEQLESPRARQRLEQAKELDQEVAAGESWGGG